MTQVWNPALESYDSVLLCVFARDSAETSPLVPSP